MQKKSNNSAANVQTFYNSIDWDRVYPGDISVLIDTDKVCKERYYPVKVTKKISEFNLCSGDNLIVSKTDPLKAGDLCVLDLDLDNEQPKLVKFNGYDSKSKEFLIDDLTKGESKKYNEGDIHTLHRVVMINKTNWI